MIKVDDAVLLVVDVQDGFASYGCFEQVVSQTARLVAGAEILGVPIEATEQYPKGLGPTNAGVGLPESVQPVAKAVFSAARAEGLQLHGRRKVVVCGIEAHVCVLQTALDLLDQGYEVHVVTDAVGSRHKEDREVGLRRLERAGCVLTTVEMTLLELCERAGTDEFKAVQRLII